MLEFHQINPETTLYQQKRVGSPNDWQDWALSPTPNSRSPFATGLGGPATGRIATSAWVVACGEEGGGLAFPAPPGYTRPRLSSPSPSSPLNLFSFFASTADLPLAYSDWRLGEQADLSLPPTNAIAREDREGMFLPHAMFFTNNV